MRISFMPITGLTYHTDYLKSFISKIDQRIALIVAIVFTALAVGTYFIYRATKQTKASGNVNTLNKNKITFEIKTCMFTTIPELITAYSVFQKGDIIRQKFTAADLDLLKINKKPWIIINQKVYNVGNFLDQHPGGPIVLEDSYYKDATQDFTDVGHSNEAKKMLEDYCIGKYVGKEYLVMKS